MRRAIRSGPPSRLFLGATILATIGVAMAWSPVAAACALSAPDTIRVGEVLTIEGAGYPPNSSVDVSLVVQGGASDSFTVTSQADGSIRITFEPELSDAGLTTVTAGSGPGCEADVVVDVLAPGDTPRPRTTVESPGNEAAAGAVASNAPSTDLPSPARATERAAVISLLAWIILGAGVAGLILAGRPTAARARK